MTQIFRNDEELARAIADGWSGAIAVNDARPHGGLLTQQCKDAIREWCNTRLLAPVGYPDFTAYEQSQWIEALEWLAGIVRQDIRLDGAITRALQAALIVVRRAIPPQ